MATQTLHTARPVFPAVADFFTALAADFRKYQEYRKTLNELNTLSDREIADLGFGHLTAQALAYKAVYGEK